MKTTSDSALPNTAQGILEKIPEEAEMQAPEQDCHGVPYRRRRAVDGVGTSARLAVYCYHELNRDRTENALTSPLTLCAVAGYPRGPCCCASASECHGTPHCPSAPGFSACAAKRWRSVLTQSIRAGVKTSGSAWPAGTLPLLGGVCGVWVWGFCSQIAAPAVHAPREPSPPL